MISDTERQLREAIAGAQSWQGPRIGEGRVDLALLLQAADALAYLAARPASDLARRLRERAAGRQQSGFVRVRPEVLLEAADALASEKELARALDIAIAEQERLRDRIADLERELAETKQRDLLALNELHDAHQAAEARLAAVAKVCDDFDWQQDYAFERFREQLKQTLAAPAQVKP